MSPKILIVDDESPVLDFLMEVLEDRGFEVDLVGERQMAVDAPHNTIEKARERRRFQKESQVLIQALERGNDRLEEKVNSRTMELKKVNEALRKELEECQKTVEELREAKKAAEVASRVKSDFIAAMSHELRNPLNTILGFSEILMEKYFGPLTEKQEQYVKDIHRGGRRLLMHINDILDLTSLENEKKTLVLSHVNICDMIESSLNFFRGKALKHGVKLDVSIAEDIGDLILKIDRRKMKQVLFNILSNAIKFTQNGGQIKVETRKIKDGQNKYLSISVAEDGNGAGKQCREAMFDEFFHVESGRFDKACSAGPDFSLCKRIVEMHGGTLAMEREGLGKRGRFTVVLPLHPPT